MNLFWGIALFIITAIAYLGQLITAIWPESAVKLGLTEAIVDVDPTYYADVRGEAYWDAAVLWTLPVAAMLLAFNNPVWAYLGLIGGGMYLYFAGRGIIVRSLMRSRGIKIGKPESLKLFTIFLILWGLAAVITIILAVASIW